MVISLKQLHKNKTFLFPLNCVLTIYVLLRDNIECGTNQWENVYFLKDRLTERELEHAEAHLQLEHAEELQVGTSILTKCIIITYILTLLDYYY